MALSNYKVTIIDRGYHYIAYTAYVSGSSRNQAIAKAGALAGQQKMADDHKRTGHDLVPSGFENPVVQIEYATHDEYWPHHEQVIVEDRHE